jgi:Domain of unknown function (DUF3303)
MRWRAPDERLGAGAGEPYDVSVVDPCERDLLAPRASCLGHEATLAATAEVHMLFYVGWKARASQGPKDSEAALEIFSRWQPPAGMEMKGMWARPDGGGFGLCETTSAEVVFEGTAPWSDAYLDYEIVPIVEMEKAVELMKKAISFRHG